MAMAAAPSLFFSPNFNNPKSQLFKVTNDNPFSLKLRSRPDASEPRRRKICAGGFFLVSEANPVENSRGIVVGGGDDDDGVAGVIVSTLLFVAFVGLSILTVGAIYIAVTDFLQKREEEKFQKEEAAAAKKTMKKKKNNNNKGPFFRGDRPRGFGQKSLMLLRLKGFKLKPFFSFRSTSSSSSSPHLPDDDIVIITISALLKKPNWENDDKLKSLVSHSSPESVSTVLSLHHRDIPLCLRFFKWACRRSTYCYGIEARIRILNSLLASSSTPPPFSVVHRALVFLINECADDSRDDFSKLMRGIEAMRERLGFRMNYPCYSTLLRVLAKLDMGLIAFFVFEDMAEKGFELSEIDYRSIVNALCKNGFVRASEMFVCRVSKLGFAFEDVHILTSLVLGNCRAGEICNALKVFDKMSAPNSVASTILIHSLCQVGKLDSALKLKDDLKGCLAPGFPSTRTYTVLIKATADDGSMDRALTLLDEMSKAGCKPNAHTYTVLIDAICREGRIKEANGMFRKMMKDGCVPGVVTYNALINGYCKEGRVLSAFELLGLMERKRCPPNIRTYNELIEGLFKIDKPSEALDLSRRVMENGSSPTAVTFNVLINGLCKARQVDAAFGILHFMKRSGVEPDQFSYTPFIDFYCKTGQTEKTGLFLGLMIKKGVPVDEAAITAAKFSG
ncbi:hypothetical protein M569_12300 [Genlisea aurea]|uniref:Pentacotripeptide-repeat region of PRORP domain-containing protein n=1 Tax=Genlisea aurea TaxID=192259 RepID=S8CDF5_9LAMI|nr:hypothetical protein M569_12300 [Genlisea aurea]